MRAKVGVVIALLLAPALVAVTPAQAGYTSGAIMHWDAGNASSYSGSGTTWSDLSGNGFTANFSSAPVYSSSNGGTLTLGAAQPFATISNSFSTNFSAGFSATFYADFGTAQSWERIIDFGGGASSSNIIVARSGSTDTLNLTLLDGPTSLGYCNANSIILRGLNHYSVTVDGNNCYFYRNGSLWPSISRFTGADVAIQAMTAVPRTVSRSSNFIGKSNYGQDAIFEGVLGEISIYNRGLSPSEVYENFLAESFLCTSPYLTTTYSGNTRYVKIVGSTGCLWVIPSSVTSLDYLIVGAGGGGGGSTAFNSNNLGGGGGGAGGAATIATGVSVTAGSVINASVGLGGAGGAPAANGTAGGDSILIVNGSVASATGGAGGGVASGVVTQAGLAGDGGGNGAYVGGASDFDGGGGGAGAGGNGGNGSDIGGQGGNGGTGGSGIQSSISSNASQWYGSGGGGGTSAGPLCSMLVPTVATTAAGAARMDAGSGGGGGTSSGPV